MLNATPLGWIQCYISHFAKVQTVLASFLVAVAVGVAQNALVLGGLSLAYHPFSFEPNPSFFTPLFVT